MMREQTGLIDLNLVPLISGPRVVLKLQSHPYGRRPFISLAERVYFSFTGGQSSGTFQRTVWDTISLFMSGPLKILA
jgi:hypothetical protein